MIKKLYSKLIIISIFSIFLIAIFYLSSAINATMKIANRDLEIDSFIKKEVDLSKEDARYYSINNNILKSDLFTKFKDYKYNSKIEKDSSNIFYNKDSDQIKK